MVGFPDEDVIVAVPLLTAAFEDEAEIFGELLLAARDVTTRVLVMVLVVRTDDKEDDILVFNKNIK